MQLMGYFSLLHQEQEPVGTHLIDCGWKWGTGSSHICTSVWWDKSAYRFWARCPSQQDACLYRMEVGAQNRQARHPRILYYVRHSPAAQYWSRLPRLLDNLLVLNMKMTVYLFTAEFKIYFRIISYLLNGLTMDIQNWLKKIIREKFVLQSFLTGVPGVECRTPNKSILVPCGS